MKRKFTLIALAVLFLSGVANATVVSARFTFDDGSPVTGHVVLYRVATPADILVGTYALDAQGHASSDIALDATATYHAQLVAATGVVLQQVWTASVSSSIASAALQVLPTGEIDVVLARADSSVKSFQFVQSALPETKFASCVSKPTATTGATTDTGGGLAVGYIVNGQTFDCAVSVATQGSYPLNVRAESPFSTAKVHFEYPAGTTVGSQVTVTPTIVYWTSPDVYQTFSAGSVTLPAGTVSIRMVVDQAGLNLNWFN